MLPRVKISSFLLKRLQAVKQQCSGCLFGVFYGEGTLLLLGFNVESTIGKLNYEKIQYKFPAEVDLCGLVKFGDCTDAEAHLNDIFKDVDITDNPIVLHCELGTLVGLRASIFMHGKLQEIPYEEVNDDTLYNDFCFTRLKCILKIYPEKTPQDVRHQLHLLRKNLTSGSLVFRIDPSNMYVTNIGVNDAQSGKNAITNESSMQDVIDAIVGNIEMRQADNKENAKGKSKNNRNTRLSSIYGALGCDYDVLLMNVLQCKTREPQTLTDDSTSSAPLPAMSMSILCTDQKMCIPLEVEAMAMLSKTTKVSRLYDVLIESICRSLRLLEHSMCEGLETDQIAYLKNPQSYYFFLKEFGHFLACSFPNGVDDDDSSMQEKRKRLHRHFALATSRPYFRRSNHCIFRNEMKKDEPLVNVHHHVRPSNVDDGKQYIVYGNYFYYHYLQQQIEDNGWGCAYRSLQTICSWFLLQGYTDRPVPSHNEIQKYLVEIGDKPRSFENSKQWIGSAEVSMCLQGFLKVDSKIIHVTSGGEVAQIAPDIVSHFMLQGTPIMIGGGQLAHTIIGIDYNSQSGQVKFLVLDPHYTGADDLQTIVTKGWCGWKGADFWNKKSYYNLCMPKIPSIY